MTVEIAGFEGEWFDTQDVQGYLEEKGIYIDPGASFAEAEMIEWPSASGSVSTASSVANPLTPPGKGMPFSPFDAQLLQTVNDPNNGFTQWSNFASATLPGVGFSDAHTGSFMNFLYPGETMKEFDRNASTAQALTTNTTIPMDFVPDSFVPADMAMLSNTLTAAPQPRKKSIVIDVTKLVKGLSGQLSTILL